jgi:hypothetical protein
MSAIVETTYGRIRGEIVDSIYVFRGIPYGDDTSGGNRFSIDWYNTADARLLFGFQNHSLDEYRKLLARKYRLVKPFVVAARPLLMRYIEHLSPYRSA